MVKLFFSRLLVKVCFMVLSFSIVIFGNVFILFVLICVLIKVDFYYCIFGMDVSSNNGYEK